MPMAKSPFTKDYERFRKILIESRKASGLTQADLSAKLLRPQSYVSKYERGERRLDVIEFLQIVNALGKDPHDIIRRIRSISE
jgi:transcriptional regulator with XRE-family HTH domain